MMTGPDAPDAMGHETAVRSYIRLLARYERLMEIGQTLNATLDLNRLLETIVRSASELTGTEAASILLVDPHSGSLRFEASIDPVGVSLDSVVVPMEGSIAGWIVTNNEPIEISDVANEPGHFSQIDQTIGFTTRNLLGVPLRAQDRVIGVLEALNKLDGEAFTDEDMRTLTTLAAQAAVAIENARLFEQSDLIAEMVHELRTPLAAITSITHILQKPELDPERGQKLVRTIRSETERLTRMTSEFLNLTRLESGRTRLARAPYDVAEVIDWCVQTVAPQADDNDVGIANEIGSGALPELVGDAPKMQQVFLNLLTNAIKYNREGGTVTIASETDDGGVRVMVSDTGVGIAPEHLPNIFQKFYRVADTEGYTHGSGLGLAIAKSIAQGHGGDLTVASEKDVGTTFTVTLPLPGDEAG